MGCPDCERLELELLEERKKAKDAAGVAAQHAVARHRAEAKGDANIREGIRQAANWVRVMPRRELIENGIRVGTEIYRLVAQSIVRYIEERLEQAERPTIPHMARMVDDDEDGE